MQVKARTIWSALAGVQTRPTVGELRDLARTGKLLPVIEVVASRRQAQRVVAVLAAAMNCDEAPDGEPCGSCAACRDAVSPSGLAVIHVEGTAATPARLRRVHRHLMEEQPGRWQFVVVLDSQRVRTRKTYAALMDMAESPPAHTTFILATTEGAGPE